MCDCAWVITGIVSRESCYVDYIMQLNGIQKAFDLLDHTSDQVKSQAMCILSRVARASLVKRDVILDMGIISKLNGIFDEQVHEQLLVNRMTWLMSELCRGEPYPTFYKVIISEVS